MAQIRSKSRAILLSDNSLMLTAIRRQGDKWYHRDRCS